MMKLFSIKISGTIRFYVEKSIDNSFERFIEIPDNTECVNETIKTVVNLLELKMDKKKSFNVDFLLSIKQGEKSLSQRICGKYLKPSCLTNKVEKTLGELKNKWKRHYVDFYKK